MIEFAPRLICRGEPFAKLKDEFILPLLGVVFGQLIFCCYRCIYCITKKVSSASTFVDYRYGGIQHIYLYLMMIVLSVIQVLSAAFMRLDFLKYTCKDYLGVESSPYFWIDWLCTVPVMFFLMSIIDADALEFILTDVVIEVLGGGSIVLLFLTNFPFPFYINTILFVASNICMGIALTWQCNISQAKYSSESIRLKRIPVHKRNETVHALTIELFQRAEFKCHCSFYFLFVFPLFPLLYYLRLFHFIELEWYIIASTLLKFMSKAIFIHVLSLIRPEAFDPIKLVLIVQKRILDSSRMRFLRFILHEIRGPLNSIALGLQVLTETSSLIDTHDDIFCAIREGMCNIHFDT